MNSTIPERYQIASGSDAISHGDHYRRRRYPCRLATDRETLKTGSKSSNGILDFLTGKLLTT